MRAEVGRRRVAGSELEVVRYPRPDRRRRPPVVLLHEGLGSVGRWSSFPSDLAERLRTEVIAYSRAGYGRSDGAPGPWPDRFMDREAHGVLPELLDGLRLDAPPVLLGHSDGGSIALLYAGGPAEPRERRVEPAGVVALAPHLFVESRTLDGIRDLDRRWRRSERFRSAFAFHHRAGRALFEAWRDVWLRPSFRAWNILGAVRRIRVPILAVQGEDDAFGTPEQLRVLEELAPQTRRLELPDCGHAPHLERPEAVLDAVGEFFDAVE
ncbi:MAG: alpha/beta hydrolase [Acidobacteriota bacterium]